MIVDLAPAYLTWDDVDPARHVFDSASAPRVVRTLGPATRVPTPPHLSAADPAMIAWSRNPGEHWADSMSHALSEHYGHWTVGWRWAHDEGDFDGGPIGNWCCPRDSITTPGETLDRVVAALREWREWLEDLAGLFDAYPLDLTEVEDQRILWERTANRLIQHVVDRTECGSSWYGHCRQVLTWFLSRWKVDPRRAEELVDAAVGGRFASWTAPDPVVVGEIAERLALSIRPGASLVPAEPLPDHLERWLAVRENVPWRDVGQDNPDGPVVPVRDGAADDVRAFDAAVDPARARGLLTALDMLRADAARGASLDFALLRRWQRHVLDVPEPPPFRELPAFAKSGRERYGIAPDTRARLDACLAESGSGSGGGSGSSAAPSVPLTARAARACLDVCFFHPFDDGNARCAFLVLVFVLAREDVALDDVSLLRRVSFQADDPQDAVTLTRWVNLLLADSRREAESGGRH